MELIGFISSGLLAVCGLPTAIIAIRTKSGKHIDDWLFWIWYIAEILGIAYVVHLGSVPLILNYSFNVLFLSIICYFKLKEY
jgi:uncharacterized protein with PQ loop repeat